SGVVSPANEQDDTAAHDVEPCPLLFNQTRAAPGEGLRHASPSPVPLLRQLPLLIHVHLHPQFWI
ncbi:unnamed protein product, partial [Musa acuminata subsp. malaccensis]